MATPPKPRRRRYDVVRRGSALKKKASAARASSVTATRSPKRARSTVHLIDALPYVFRAYFALPGTIKDSAGRQSNAVVGFANFLLRYLADEVPTHAALCFDRSLTSSFRNKLYPAYKSNRTLPPPELKGQIERCRKFAEVLGLACYDDKSYEADDLIASLATPLASSGHSCIIVTNDKDMCQLVGPRVTLYDYAKGERLDAAGVHKKLGVRPEQVTDFLGLAGDSTDCIPGVKGVGAKTAVKLLARFDDLEALYTGLPRAVARLRALRGARGIAERLEAHRDTAFLSRTLATLARDALPRYRGASVVLAALARPRRPQPRRLGEVLKQVSLTKLRARIDALPPPPAGRGGSSRAGHGRSRRGRGGK